MLTHAELERRAYIAGDIRAAGLYAALAGTDEAEEVREDIAGLVGEALDSGLADIPEDIPGYLHDIADDLLEQIDALDLVGVDTSDLTVLADRVAEEARDLKTALDNIREWLDKAADRLSGASK